MSQYNDIEEGEIVEDSPSHEHVKAKTLPRRYRIHNSYRNAKRKRKRVPKLTNELQIKKNLAAHKNTGHFCSRHRSSLTKCCGVNNTPSFTYSQRRFVRQKISPLRTVNVSANKCISSYKCTPTTIRQIKSPVKPVITHTNNFVNIDLPTQSVNPNSKANIKTLSINSSFDDLLAIYKIKQDTNQKNPILTTPKSCTKRDESVASRSQVCNDVKFNNYRDNNVRNHKKGDKLQNYKEDNVYANYKENDKYVNYKEDNKYANYREGDKYVKYKDDKYVNYKEDDKYVNYKEDDKYVNYKEDDKYVNYKEVDKYVDYKEDDKFRNYKENDKCKDSKHNLQVCDKNVVSKQNLSPDSTSKPIESIHISGSDDEEEELRRIALASILKQNTNKQKDSNSCQNKTNLSQIRDAANTFAEDKSSSNSSSYLMPNFDNYEVVDMDLDADQSACDIENNLYIENQSNMMRCKNDLYSENQNNMPCVNELFSENRNNMSCGNELFSENQSNMQCSDFFVIDTNPTIFDQKYPMELFGSDQALYVNRPLHNKNICVVDTPPIKEPIPVLDRNKPAKNKSDIWKKLVTITPTDTQHAIHKIESSCLKPNVRERSSVVNKPQPVVKKVTPVVPSKKLSACARSTFVPRERIVIKLTGESSSDESDDENSNRHSEDATFASIEALISSARQMSNEKAEEKQKGSSTEAVSCLSQAQQQEYNKLKKIIAQKESNNTQQKLVHSSFGDLKLLEKNLILARSTLQKEKRYMITTRPEVAKKKKNFLSSQLMYQKIREQLAAAEIKKNEDAQLYNKSVLQYQALQNSVTKRNTLIRDLERECKRLGTTVHGDNYKPPAVTFPSLNRIKYVKRSHANSNL